MKSRALRRRYGHTHVGLPGAVRAMRLYLGAVDYVPVPAQQRFYDRAKAAVGRVAHAKKMDAADAWSQIESEARKRGLLRPVPGQHL